MAASRTLSVALGSALLAVALQAQPAAAVCGQPETDDSGPKASDALFVLRASVGSETCEPCICDVDNSGSIVASDALLVLRAAVGDDVTLDCPGCTSGSAECPGVAQFAIFAGIRGACESNADCQAFSTCDTGIHRCRTATENDIGWNGLAHNEQLNDPIPARLFLDCEGPAPCGECTITGHDPSLGDCRCDNDNRKVCFTVAGNDEANCGGGFCTCYFGPPMPLSAGNTPVCVLNGLSRQPSGQANVDVGTGNIHLPLSEKIFLGASLLAPCPVCINDPTPADGVRGGVCVGGRNDTQSCDAQAYNNTFPPPTGALYSLDCFPLEGADISNGGLPLEIELTTGTTSLPATLPCGGDETKLCPCRVCSGDEQLACHSDADCSAAGAGTCSSDGNGVATMPNACTNGVCEDQGNDEGLCAGGPDDSWCDAIVRPDGTGLVGCGTNEDCAPVNIGVDAGTGSLLQRRPCFLDPIVSHGSPSPVIPLAAGTYCSPATAAQSVNLAAGLPGPGRLTLQTFVSLYCNSDPEAEYTPGVGGCPPAEAP